MRERASSRNPVSRMMLATFGTLVLLAVAIRAWGPGNHLEFAERVYRRRRELLGSQVATLLGEERRAFLYGNIAADIINFKAFGGHRNHCHRWTIVSEMRELATKPIHEAFCTGYLSHLAADTIAHNHFVPYHLVRFARARGLGHLYWEMSADRFIGEGRWKTIADLKRDGELDELDELIDRTVSRKAFSMRTNKLIFNHVLLVSERDQWRRGVDKIHPIARVSLSKGFLERFRKAAVDRVRLALRAKGMERLAHLDTTGKAAQKRASQLRRKLVTTLEAGKRRNDQAETLAAEFLEGMSSPPPAPGDPHW